ncbi:MAG: hypothetical protein KF804_07495 [Burkholderiales bacterium]|nr:hypothetical protein [Burkholderiales bacterium]
MKAKSINWHKLGLIYQPDTSLSWQASHAALPTRMSLGGSQFRIFFSSRDKDNRAHVGRFDLDLEEPRRILDTTKHPVLEPGDWGFFDDHGVQACSLVKADNGDIYLYYLGWNTGKKEPLFYASMGLAISRDGGGTFHKYSPAPILQRSRFDPWMVSGGTVIRKKNQWVMYYLSGFKFEFTSDIPTSWYDIKIARSSDGIEWTREGEVALGLQEGETNISRMTIDEHAGGYRAWFPVKRKGACYQCGYAESVDGTHWVRREGMCLPVSRSGWDSEAIDKMEVVRHGNRLFMFYNGNRFGLDGIGLAYSDV